MALHPCEGNSVPVGARAGRSGRVGLYGRPLVPPHGSRPRITESARVSISIHQRNRLQFSLISVGVLSGRSFRHRFVGLLLGTASRQQRHGCQSYGCQDEYQDVNPEQTVGKRTDTSAKWAKMEGKRKAICALRIVPMIATPMVPPMVRVNCVEAVATPRSFQGTAFCTASTNAVLANPSPAPITSIVITINGNTVSAVKKVIIPAASVASPRPNIDVKRYP